MVQKTITPLVLPNAKEAAFGNQPFSIPFPHLQKGDIAFSLRLENNLLCQGSTGVFVNLQTVNYILHCIQHFRNSEASWRDCFWNGFGLHRLNMVVADDPERLCTHIIWWCMAPFGVVASLNSSDQGMAMIVDGRVDVGMLNYWASFIDNLVDNEIALPQAGDELILVLEEVKMNLDDDALERELDQWTYVLPNHREGSVKMTFPIKWPEHIQRMVGPRPKEHSIWQLVPSFASASNKACWERGFWRLGTAF